MQNNPEHLFEFLKNDQPSENYYSNMTTTQMQLSMINDKRKRERELSKVYIFNNYQAACEMYEELEKNEKIPDYIMAVAYHRRFVKPSFSLF